jgi:hypothetical protein
MYYVNRAHYRRLGLDRSALEHLRPEEARAAVKAVGRALRAVNHPDAGGNAHRFGEVDRALEAVTADVEGDPQREPTWDDLMDLMDHERPEVQTEQARSWALQERLESENARLQDHAEDLELLLQQRVEDGLLTHLRRPYQVGLRLVGGTHVEASISRARREVTLPEEASVFGPGPFVVLGWLEDESTSAPRSVRGDGGDPYRLFRLTALEGRFHKLALEPEVGRWLVVLDRSAQHQMERFRFLGRVTRI